MLREHMSVVGWFVDTFRFAGFDDGRGRIARGRPYRWQPAVDIRDGRTACTLMDFSNS